MKESNITSALVKSKMSGYEVGRLMIQDYLFGIKQTYEGVENPQGLLNPQEVQYIQDQLTDSYDIKIYNSCRRLWEYLEHISYITTITKKDIDIIAFKIYLIISNEIKSEGIRSSLNSGKNKENPGDMVLELGLINIERDSKLISVPDMFNEFVGCLKKWLLFLEVFNLISERMELPDIMILVDGNPFNKVKLVESLIKDLQFLYPENIISKALIEKGIGHIYASDEVPKNTDIINIEELKPSQDKIAAAKEAIKDLTYFKNNWGIHSILEDEAGRCAE